MSVTQVFPVEAITEAAKQAQAAAPGQADFADWLGSQISSTEMKIAEAESQVQQLALGEAENLHQVMIALSKAQTSFELTVQVRNRILESIQELMRMNI
jgi:flagellar hook-basal body complex protein FliE